MMKKFDKQILSTCQPTVAHRLFARLNRLFAAALRQLRYLNIQSAYDTNTSPTGRELRCCPSSISKVRQ